MAPDVKQAVTPEAEPGRQAKNDPALNAAIGEQMRSMARSVDRVTKATGPQQVGNLITPLIPMPEHEAEFYDAKKELEKAVVAKVERIKSDIDVEDKTHLFFYRCRRCNLHAFYFTVNPSRTGGIVKQEAWYSTYKRKNELFYMMTGRPLCQSCLANGEKIEVPVAQANSDGSFIPEDRWVFARARDPKRLAVEGEFRAKALANESQNTGRNAAMARAKAAGYEVLQ